MKTTLTSIQKPHTDNIFDGIKIIEWRTMPLPEGLHFVYEAKAHGGCGRVIGRMNIIPSEISYSVDEIPEILIEAGCVSREYLRKYAKGKKLYPNYILFAKRFEHPMPLNFMTPYCKHMQNQECNKYNCPHIDIYEYPWNHEGYYSCNKTVSRPPQSYMFIDVIGEHY